MKITLASKAANYRRRRDICARQIIIILKKIFLSQFGHSGNNLRQYVAIRIYHSATVARRAGADADKVPPAPEWTKGGVAIPDGVSPAKRAPKHLQ